MLWEESHGGDYEAFCKYHMKAMQQWWMAMFPERNSRIIAIPDFLGNFFISPRSSETQGGSACLCCCLLCLCSRGAAIWWKSEKGKGGEARAGYVVDVLLKFGWRWISSKPRGPIELAVPVKWAWTAQSGLGPQSRVVADGSSHLSNSVPAAFPYDCPYTWRTWEWWDLLESKPIRHSPQTPKCLLHTVIPLGLGYILFLL